MATGVLVVLAGKATKLLPYLENTDKEYKAEIELGSFTDTQDVSGTVTESLPVNRDFDFQKELDKFLGKQKQKIPMRSAKKVNGKKLMDYQRQGIEIKPQYKDVEIYSINALDDKALEFEVECSSGTFVRSICEDLAINTGNAGAMKSLVRTKACGFTLDEAEDLELEEHTLHPIEEVLTSYEKIVYDKPQDIINGKRIYLPNARNDEVVIYDGNKALAIYKRVNGNQFASSRGLF